MPSLPSSFAGVQFAIDFSPAKCVLNRNRRKKEATAQNEEADFFELA
jgi:hypothetical protein